MTTPKPQVNVNEEYEKLYGFHVAERSVFKATPGLDEEKVKQISGMKGEPSWMLDFRLRGYRHFINKPMPQWANTELLNSIKFNDIFYYLKPTAKQGETWDEVPAEIKETFDRLGIPEAERKFLAGVSAQYDSEAVYHSMREDLQKQGVIFLDMDTALKEHPEIIKKHFGTIIPPADNKFAALNTAVWSGGCLTADAKVSTVNPGLKSIAKIAEGDEVFAATDEGQLTRAKVIARIFSGRKPVYRLFVAGRTLEATGNHHFLCLEKSPVRLNIFGKRWRRAWKPLDSLKEGDLIAVAKKLPDTGRSRSLPRPLAYVKNHHLERRLQFPHQTNEDLMWLLGLWLGDGNTYFPTPHMCFTNFAIPVNDPIRRKAIRVIKTLFRYEVKTANRVSFTVNSKAFGRWLQALDFTGRAKTKRIPEWVFGLPLNERLALLGGLLDSDGYLDGDGSKARFELANQGLVQDIKLLAIGCGLYSNGQIVVRRRKNPFFKREHRHIKGSTSYSCRITGDLKLVGTRNAKIRCRIRAYPKRTRDKYRSTTGENFLSATTEFVGFAPIRSKRYVGRKDVYDIQVEPHANFVANGIVAHNSFIYVPKGIKVEMPLQAYFRINAKNMGQFERTLIIADEGAEVCYFEGCTAPVYSSDSLHSAVVELIAMPRAKIRYVTIQNWSKNVYNLVTKRAVAHEGATVQWLDGNLGSRLTMKYPGVYLMGRGAHGEVLSVAFAGDGQHQDAGAKMIHAAPDTSSVITSKSISKGTGRTSYRGLVKVYPGATNAKSTVRCDALLLNPESRSDTYPTMEIDEKRVQIGHEATVSKIGDEQLFYAMSRGLSEQEAMSMIVNGFIEPFVKALPLEYAVELNRLVQLEMEGAVG